MKLALDHHYSPAIATELRHRGHDVIAVAERGWETEDDASLLALCHQEVRALLTNNVADFTLIARRWAPEGSQHSGLVFTSDASMPRTSAAIGRYVEALEKLLSAYPSDDALADGVLWVVATGVPDHERHDRGGGEHRRVHRGQRHHQE